MSACLLLGTKYLRPERKMSLTSTAATAANPWIQILSALEKKINRHSYDTWLKPTRYSHSNGAILFVRVPTAEFRHIGEKYADLIQEAMDNLAMEFNDVQFVTAEEDPTASPKHDGANVNMKHDGGFAPASAHSTNAPARGNSAAGSTTIAQSRFDWDTAAQLNPKYTFPN